MPPPRRRIIGRRGPVEAARRPIGDDVLEQAGEVVLARNADPAADPVLVLRVAEAAARTLASLLLTLVTGLVMPLRPRRPERLGDGPLAE